MGYGALNAEIIQTGFLGSLVALVVGWASFIAYRLNYSADFDGLLLLVQVASVLAGIMLNTMLTTALYLERVHNLGCETEGETQPLLPWCEAGRTYPKARTHERAWPDIPKKAGRTCQKNRTPEKSGKNRVKLGSISDGHGHLNCMPNTDQLHDNTRHDSCSLV
jgi:hypothetical protein